jgi:hypothetical protein
MLVTDKLRWKLMRVVKHHQIDKIHLAFGQEFAEAGQINRLRADNQINRRMVSSKTVQFRLQIAQDVPLGGQCQPHARRAATPGCELPFKFGQLLQDAVSACERALPFRRDSRNSTGSAIEQLHAQQVLEGVDVLADSRLRHADLFSTAAKTPDLDDLNENLELPDRQCAHE